MNANNLGVALVHSICPVCTKKVEKSESIILNTRLTPGLARAVEEMHGKATGFELCEECKPIIDSGGVFLVEVDPTKSEIKGDKILPQDAYRTGRLVAIKGEAARRIFGDNVAPINFIEPEVSEKLGLFKEQADGL